jgi:hypothetical protein
MTPANLFKIKQEQLVGAVLLLLTIFSLISFLCNLRNIRTDTYTAVYGVDLIACYTAAKLVEAGDASEIYAQINEDFSVVNSGKFYETARESGFKLTPTRYIYLPIFLAPFQKFTTLNFYTLADLWLIMNLVIILVVMILQWHFTKEIFPPAFRSMIIISVNLLSFPLFYALKLGQTTIVIYLIICLIYYFTLRRRDIAAGILLGFIVAMKYSPFLIAIYFLYRKRYSLVISCLATVAFIILLSIVVYGMPLNKMYFNYLINLSGMGIAGWSNQSLYALLLRQFTESDVLAFYPEKVGIWFSVFRYTVVFSLISIIFVFIKKNRDQDNMLLYSLEFSAMLLCFLIISPVSWLHYLILTVLPFILIVSHCLKKNMVILKPFLFSVSIAGYLMIALHPDYHRLIAYLGQNFFSKLLISMPFFGTFILLAIDLCLMRTKSENVKKLK